MVALFDQAFGVLKCRTGVVDRARPQDHQEPIILVVNDVLNDTTRLGDQAFDGRGLNGKKTYQMLRGRQDRDVFDPLIVGFTGSVHALNALVLNVLLLAHLVPLDRLLSVSNVPMERKKTAHEGGLFESFERLQYA